MRPPLSTPGHDTGGTTRSGRHARTADTGARVPPRAAGSAPRHARPAPLAESTAYLTATGTVVLVHRGPAARSAEPTRSVDVPRFTAGADCTDPSYPALLNRVASCLRSA